MACSSAIEDTTLTSIVECESDCVCRKLVASREATLEVFANVVPDLWAAVSFCRRLFSPKTDVQSRYVDSETAFRRRCLRSSKTDTLQHRGEGSEVQVEEAWTTSTWRDSAMCLMRIWRLVLRYLSLCVGCPMPNGLLRHAPMQRRQGRNCEDVGASS